MTWLLPEKTYPDSHIKLRKSKLAQTDSQKLSRQERGKLGQPNTVSEIVDLVVGAPDQYLQKVCRKGSTAQDWIAAGAS